MPSSYRDPLTAALARIKALEKELESRQASVPTEIEAEAIRLKHDLMRVDVAWEEKKRILQSGGGDARGVRLVLSGVALVFFGLGVVLLVRGLTEMPLLIPVALVPVVVGALLWLWVSSSYARYLKARRRHEENRARVISALAELRLGGPRRPAEVRIDEAV